MSRARDIAGRYLGALKADTISHPSASVTSITLDSAGAMTGSFPSPNRNLLYNGAMQVSQRGTSTTSITTSGYYTADRWAFGPDSMGTFTMTVENDAPTDSGLRRSVKVLCTTADAAPAASDSIGMTQSLEGQDLQRIRKGTSSAQKLTLSFWVKANVTGTYVAELIDSDNGRRVSGSYSVTASATWEKKTVTLAADMTGALDNDNAVSLVLRFWLGAGSNFTSGSPLQTAWGTATNTRATGQTNLAASTNNYWQVTGVQLEIGDTATDFEFKSCGRELQECQRYYQTSLNFGTTIASGGNSANIFCIARDTSNARVYASQFPIKMRIAPEITVHAEPNGASGSITNDNTGVTVTGCSATQITQSGFGYVTKTSGLSSGETYRFNYTASAEL